MQILANISLKPYNTFGIDVQAKHFASFSSTEMLAELLSTPSVQNEPLLVLGGGSNLLFTKPFEGLVLKNERKGIELVGEDSDHYYVRAEAGENWHGFVQYCIGRGYAGLENLSLIPGNVGASPMQNIGAYGVEIRDVFHELEAFHTKEATLHRFSLADCEFGYRESVFKKQYRGQFVILNVTFRLRKRAVFHVEYGAIKQELERAGVKELSLQAVSDAVIAIRTSKLPDPRQTGNAGSFFKNPVITADQYASLLVTHPSLPGYPAGEGLVKTAAGWLIEQCGWKGYRRGDAGCYPQQALVLVNYGGASGAEVLALSEDIIKSVQEKFSITLEREVNIL